MLPKHVGTVNNKYWWTNWTWRRVLGKC